VTGTWLIVHYVTS